MSSFFRSPTFYNEIEGAIAFVEAMLWPRNGPVCPHCGAGRPDLDLRARRGRIGLKEVRPMPQAVHGAGRHDLRASSHIPLHKWLQAIHLMCSSQEGHQRPPAAPHVEVTYKTAWFLAHRIREAMRSGDLAPMGGDGKMVEADETYIGRLPDAARSSRVTARQPAHKNAVLTLVERGGSSARSMSIARRVDEIAPIIRD